MGKGSGGSRFNRPVQTPKMKAEVEQTAYDHAIDPEMFDLSGFEHFTVKNTEGRDVDVLLDSAEQKQALLAVLERTGPVPPSVTFIRSEFPIGGVGGYEYDYLGHPGGLWMEGMGEIVIENRTRVNQHLTEAYGPGYSVYDKYEHTWAHEIGHAWFSQWADEGVQSGGSGPKWDRWKAVEKLAHDANQTYAMNWGRTAPTHRYSPFNDSAFTPLKTPHRLDKATEYMAEAFAVYTGAKHPGWDAYGVSFFRPPKGLAAIFKANGFKDRTRPENNKVGYWEPEWKGSYFDVDADK